VFARISKGVTGGSDALDGGGVIGGNKSEAAAGLLERETGVGPPPMEMRVYSSNSVRGDGVVLRAEARSLVAPLTEERPDKY
jgi:hypothetical protein